MTERVARSAGGEALTVRVVLETRVGTQRYALATPADLPEVALLFREQGAELVVVDSAAEQDQVAERLLADAAHAGGEPLTLTLADGAERTVFVRASVTFREREYLLVSESPLSGEAIVLRRGEGDVLDVVTDPAECRAIDMHARSVLESFRVRWNEAEPARSLLAEGRERLAELAQFLASVPVASRGTRGYEDLAALAVEMRARIDRLAQTTLPATETS